ncbi:MAG TPA: class I SAM-dependent methyltransferase [Stellaceae bacterium]|nr:class I SAM-dependent methyltransferase [Stellaceae bacterium]HEV2302233.1 class I SAM-dependent methyltransferase [Stellaceae bacterium]
MILQKLAGLQPNQDISQNDGMYWGNGRHYFGVGRSAALALWTALSARLQYAGGEAEPRIMLDFGCGHGRVARYIRAQFPQARVEVTDLNRDGVAWCVEHLGCHDAGNEIPSGRYDLVWVGSVFTHLPEHTALDLLARLKLSLRPYGVLLYTTQGRLSAATLETYVSGNGAPINAGLGLQRDAAAEVLADFLSRHFGFRAYAHRHDYGIAVGRLEWWSKKTCDDATIQLLAQEGGWDTHQDILAFMRVPGLLQLQTGVDF